MNLILVSLIFIFIKVFFLFFSSDFLNYFLLSKHFCMKLYSQQYAVKDIIARIEKITNYACG